MNDELKATLEWLKECGEHEYIFETGNSKMLLDYITNLQETIDFQDKWLEYYKDFISENNIKDYKSRKEKAVEYIKENCITSDSWKDLDFCNFVSIGKITYKELSKSKIKELLNILNGRSDE